MSLIPCQSAAPLSAWPLRSGAALPPELLEPVRAPATNEWLRRGELALGDGDSLQCAEWLMLAADECLAGQDPDEAGWHLRRAARVLDGVPVGARSLTLRCQLAEQTLAWARARAATAEHAAVRHLVDQARDLCFEVVRAATHLRDLAERIVLLLRVAELLDALGDTGDAQALRTRALDTLDAPTRP